VDSKPLPRTANEWVKAVLGFFDRDLAGNGQHFSLDEILEHFPEKEEQVQEAVYCLLQDHRLFEISPRVYGARREEIR